MRYRFPKNFLWGASTSAHQVEGGLENDWSRWEYENAGRLAKTAGRNWYDWQQEKFPEMFSENNYMSVNAARQFDLFNQDLDLIKKLGHNVHRFSLDWSRIQPEKGRFSRSAMKYYLDFVRGLKKRKVEPFVTLYHWPLPLWLADVGGWENSNAVDYFKEYCVGVGELLKGEVKFIVTINEPLVFSGQGYVTGQWPPGVKNIWRYLKVVEKLITAHIEVYKELKKINPDYQVGIAKQNCWFEAYQGKLVNKLLKKAADWWINERFLYKINDYQDYIGLNHYFHNRIDYGFGKNENNKMSDLGWELYPKSIYYSLLELKKFGKPVYITEHGLADRDDCYRPWFIRESLKYIWKAINRGVNVRGYIHWSLMDNFEWDKGFWPRFGLVAVDYNNYKRIPRQSAYMYKEIIENGGL